MAGEEYRSLATLEAVPRILSIHEVPRCTSFGGARDGADGALASGSASPEPGTPEEMHRVSSAKRLGDDIVHLGAEHGVNLESVIQDFPREFDPLASSRRSWSGHERRVELEELFGTFGTPDESCVRERLPMYVDKLPSTQEANIQNSLDEIFPMPKDDTPKAKQVPARLVAELPIEVPAAELPAGPQAFALKPLAEDCALDAPSIACPGLAEEKAPRLPHLEAALPAPVPELEDRSGLLDAAGSRRRGRSLDASLPKPDGLMADSADVLGCVDRYDMHRSHQHEDLSSTRRGRSADDWSRGCPRRSEEPPLFHNWLEEQYQLQPMPDIPLFQQVQELQLEPLQQVLPADVQAKSDDGYLRFMRDADNLLAWDVPGQAYLKYCEANSKHEDLCGQKSGDAYRGMARSLSVGAGFASLVPGLPNTLEERLDLGMSMLELAVATGTTKLGDARSDPKLANLRQLRSSRFAALMEQVPATGLDALAVTAGAGVAAMAAVAGIQPVSLVSLAPSPPVRCAPLVPQVIAPSVFPDPAQVTDLVTVRAPESLVNVREVDIPKEEDSDDDVDEDDEEEGEDVEDADGEDDSEEEGEKPDEEEEADESDDEASNSEASQANDDEGAASESDAESTWAEAVWRLFGW